ncbi:MAG: hypothetical protein JKY08_06190 [Flavobacteriaceae bacterium]|nr:hypothetical protein [Flavobacteriaceae bacterium]
MSILIIEVFKENESLDIREGVSVKTGKPWKQISQIAYVSLGGKFPVETSIPMQDGQPFYKAGKYQVHYSSFKVGDFNKLEFGREIILVALDGKDF